MSVAGVDERQVEQALREILAPLDRQLERGNLGLGLGLAVVVPALFLALWLVVGIAGRRAAGWSAGAFGLVVVLGVGWDYLMAHLARVRFDRRFGRGSPERAVALRVLSEMESPSRAEEKLREALRTESPERIVRHRREGEAPAEAPPQADAPRRPGGYYDYIPLEPRTPGGSGEPGASAPGGDRGA